MNARPKAVSRLMILMVALAALALSLSFAIRPAYAVALHDGPATLKGTQVGTDSSTAQDDCSGEDAVPAGQVLWHFILNQVTPGITQGIPGHFEFKNSADQNVNSSKWNPGGDTHHFYVYTPGDDVIDGATADIGDSQYGEFVLSHICHGPSQSVSQSVEQSVEASQSAEQSVEAGTGTPAGSQPNTSLIAGAVSLLPTIAFSLILLASLGALAFANVRMARRRS